LQFGGSGLDARLEILHQVSQLVGMMLEEVQHVGHGVPRGVIGSRSQQREEHAEFGGPRGPPVLTVGVPDMSDASHMAERGARRNGGRRR
jgi:hypothetical protein